MRGREFLVVFFWMMVNLLTAVIFFISQNVLPPPSPVILIVFFGWLLASENLERLSPYQNPKALQYLLIEMGYLIANVVGLVALYGFALRPWLPGASRIEFILSYFLIGGYAFSGLQKKPWAFGYAVFSISLAALAAASTVMSLKAGLLLAVGACGFQMLIAGVRDKLRLSSNSVSLQSRTVLGLVACLLFLILKGFCK